MCGIAGILSSSPVELSAIASMTDTLLHRGPDAQGVFISKNKNIALGHTRLSIIDLSQSANQPFYSANGRYVTVFNGEIYNFKKLREKLEQAGSPKFRTTSDTEVIVEAFSLWGKKMVEQLEGMFAIAIADQQTGKLHLFRDRVGKKPLYYFRSKSLFAFASEIKSLLRLSAIEQKVSLNTSHFSTFFHLGYLPEPHTVYSDIFKFPAGHTGELDADLNFTTRAYWKIENYLNNNINESAPEQQLELLLEDAVRQRLVSDVPLGAFLSGGTDSSLITAIASKQVSSPLKTFSIGFKENKFDEREYAQAVSKHLGTDHTAYLLAESEAIGLLNTYVSHFDEPFADTSAIPTMLVSKLARKEVKVVLTGDGGDELFQGYGSYNWANRLNNPFLKIMKRPAHKLLSLSGNSRWQRVAHLFERVEKRNVRSHIFSQEQYFFSQHELENYLLKRPSTYIDFSYEDPSTNRMLTEGEKQALFDLQYYLKDDLLVKVDRASMYYALECRSPLLDHKIIEYAFSLDHKFKRKHGTSKWILKQILKPYLPQALISRPKWGFSVPLGKWLKTDLGYLMNEFLSDDLLNQAGIVNVAYVNKLKKDFFSGKDYLYNRLWVIIVFHKWWKEHGIHP